MQYVPSNFKYKTKITEKEILKMKNMMFVRGLLIIMLLLPVGVFTGCGDKDQDQGKTEKVSAEDVKEKTMEAYDATKA